MEEMEKKRQRRRIDEETKRKAIENYKDPERELSLEKVAELLGINANYGHPRVDFFIYNNSRQLLEWTQRTIGGGIDNKEDGYRLHLYREEAVEILRRLPITHGEKVATKELILHYADNGGIGMEALRDYQSLRRRIDDEVRLCTMQARLEWIRKHGKPHKDDPDQTIPPNQPLSPLFFPFV